jgi:anaerobic ribonucleoside-triphosphate reductase activating protein
MNYATIKYNDISNGPGIRTSLFVSGCTHHCKGCFNSIAWDFDYGEPFTRETEDSLLEMLAVPYIRGLTVLGGEPFEPSNQRALLPFLRRVRGVYPAKDIWAFSGFMLEELQTEGHRARCEATDEMLSLIDVLVDGRYVHALRNLSLKFRGSSNQRLIDMRATRERGEVVLWEK